LSCTYTAKSSVSRTQLGTTQGGFVGYGFVQEIIGEHAEGGKITYRYRTTDDLPDIVQREFPFPPSFEFDWGRGLLVEQKTYRNELGVFQPVSSIKNEYQNYAHNTGSFLGLSVGTRVQYPQQSAGGLVSMAYETGNGLLTLSKQTQKTYDPENSTRFQEVVTDYTYASSAHVFPTKTETANSNGDVIETISKYPPDYATPHTIVADLVSRNRIAETIERITNANGTVAQAVAKKFEYHSSISRIFQTEDYAYESDGTAIFTPSTDGYSFPSYQRKNIMTYDINGILREAQREENAKVVYLWGYNQTVPIARIINADLASVETVFTMQELSDIKGNTYLNNDVGLRTILNKLRNDVLLPDAMVTTYTYDPLVGLTSMTDENGITIHYEYDQHNRLERIKDFDENKIREFDYQYGNN
ncbi:MAG: RHS repeat domain-containing protein, partial [Cyclobacteriaceae bacterium]